MSSKRPPTSAEAKTLIAEFLMDQVPDLRAAYLFGSRATGEANANSDFDIAVLSERSLSPRIRLDLTEALTDLLAADVDLVDLQTAPTVLRSQIIGKGVRLYAKSPAHLDAFENFVFADYARLNEERAGILQDIKSRGSIRG